MTIKYQIKRQLKVGDRVDLVITNNITRLFGEASLMGLEKTFIDVFSNGPVFLREVAYMYDNKIYCHKINCSAPINGLYVPVECLKLYDENKLTE